MNNNGFINPLWLCIAIAFGACLFVLTHIPARWMAATQGVWEWDKLIHFVAYGILAWLCFKAIQPDHLFLRWTAVFVFLIILAALDEMTQNITGRQADWLDFSADVIGILTVFVYYLSHRLSRRKQTTTPKSNTT